MLPLASDRKLQSCGPMKAALHLLWQDLEDSYIQKKEELSTNLGESLVGSVLTSETRLEREAACGVGHCASTRMAYLPKQQIDMLSLESY